MKVPVNIKLSPIKFVNIFDHKFASGHFINGYSLSWYGHLSNLA